MVLVFYRSIAIPARGMSRKPGQETAIGFLIAFAAGDQARHRECRRHADDDEDRGDDECHPLHHRIIAVRDGLVDVAAHSRQSEMVSMMTVPPSSPAIWIPTTSGSAARRSDDVAADDPPLGKPFGARHADVLLAEHFEHRRAGVPHEDGGQRQG